MHVFKNWMTGRWCVNSCRLAGRSRLSSWVRCGAPAAFPMPPSCCEPCWSTWPRGCSLKETVTSAQQAGWCDVSAVALFQRLRAAEQWLRWMADQLWQRHPTPSLPHGYRVRAIDATTVSRPGSLGTDWRVHFSVNLEDLQCDFFEVTDAHGGETFRRIPVAGGDLLLGDRCYGTPPGIAHVAQAGGHVLVRVNHKALPLFDIGRETVPAGRGTACDDAWDRSGSGRPSSATADATIRGGWWRSNETAGRPLWSGGRCGSGRPRSKRSCRGRRCSWRGTSSSGPTCRRQTLDAAAVLAWYRCRWQIELYFKRMKSILGLGDLPKKREDSCRAWLHGKLLVALLLERLLDNAEHFSPWGYELAAAAQSLA